MIPSRAAQEAQLRKVLPKIAEELIESNPIYMRMADPEVLEKVKHNIIAHWEEIQAIAALVPEASQFRAWFRKLGAPTTPQEIEISEEQARVARDYGHYLRERFSINNIRHLFGWE